MDMGFRCPFLFYSILIYYLGSGCLRLKRTYILKMIAGNYSAVGMQSMIKVVIKNGSIKI